MRGEIEALIDKELKNYPINERIKDDIEFGECYAGADLGKKRHPTHVAVFEAVREKEKVYLIQVATIWLDGVDYNDQVKIFEQAIRRFGIVAMLWDNTRGEFDGFSERGELPDEMKPYTFTAGGKEQIAAEFDKVAGNKTIILIDDERQTRSILAVDGNLQAAESPEGHGDAFWSISLAIKAFTENNVALMI